MHSRGRKPPDYSLAAAETPSLLLALLCRCPGCLRYMLGDLDLGCVYVGGGRGGGRWGVRGAPLAAAFHQSDHLLWHGDPFPCPRPCCYPLSHCSSGYWGVSVRCCLGLACRCQSACRPDLCQTLRCAPQRGCHSHFLGVSASPASSRTQSLLWQLVQGQGQNLWCPGTVGLAGFGGWQQQGSWVWACPCSKKRCRCCQQWCCC